MNFEWKYIFLGGVSVILLCVITDIIGDYSKRAEEILSMGMVFTPLIIVFMVILEACYKFFVWVYKKINAGFFIKLVDILLYKK